MDAYTPFGIAAQDSIERLSAQMMKNLPGTRSGEDIEALHDMRVASRRLRAALRVFAACFPKELLKAVVTDVQDVTRSLGAVRDLDVFLDFLEGYAGTSDDEIGWIVEPEKKIREEARGRMMESLDDLERGNLPGDISALLASTGMVDESDSFYLQAPSLIGPPLKELIKLSDAIEDSEMVAELHLMRIAAKRLRYAMETFIPCFGQTFVGMIDEIKLLQEELGEVHDCDVWMLRLAGYRNETDAERGHVLEGIIAERKGRRDLVFEQVGAHWHRLVDSGYARNLKIFIRTEPSVGKTEIGDEMRKVVKEEVVVTSVAATEKPKPVVRRPRAAAKPVEAAAPVAKAPVAKAPVAKAPVAKAPVAKPPVIAVAEAGNTPVEHQHPVIEELKELVISAASRLTVSDELSAKMVKQLGRVEEALDELPGKLQALKLKEAAKAEKLMAEMKEHLHALAGGDDISEKKTEKLRQDIRTVRRKLKDITTPKGE